MPPWRRKNLPMTKHRVSFIADEDFKNRLDRLMPWGYRSAVCRTLLEHVMDAIDKHGPLVCGAIVGGDFKITYKDRIKQDESGET